MFRLVLLCTLVITFLCLPVNVWSQDRKEPIVTPKILQEGFNWNIDWSRLFMFSRENVREAANIRDEIQDKIRENIHVIDLQASDFKGVDVKEKDLTDIKTKVDHDMEEKRNQFNFWEGIRNFFGIK